MSNKILSIIIVNYQSDVLLERCLASIYRKIPSYLGFEIIVVNNDQTDLNECKRKFNGIRLLDHRENIGFGAGANLGSALSQGEILLFLNPDSEIQSDNIFQVLEYFNANGEAAVLGSRIMTEDGRVQKWIAGYEATFYDLIRNNMGISRNKRIWQSADPIPVDWAAGTALFAKKDCFDLVKGFDENFFMYFEDMDLCKRLRKIGKKIWYYPPFEVKHLEGKSYRDKARQKRDYYQSQEYYFEKHRGALERAAVRLAGKMLVRL